MVLIRQNYYKTNILSPIMKKKKVNKSCKPSCDSSTGCGYFLGLIGAAIYFIGQSTSFWTGVVGFIKALIWPIFLVLELLKFIGA